MTSADAARCFAIGVAICRKGLARIFASTRSNRPWPAKSGAENPTAAIVSTRSPAPLSRALSRATRAASGSMSLASTFTRKAFAAAMASTPVPVPRSSTRWGRRAFSTESSSNRQPRVVPWWPVPNASAASISMPSLLGGTFARSCRPCTMNRPARTGTSSSSVALTQSLASTVSKLMSRATSSPAARRTSSRIEVWSGTSAKCTVTSQRPSGPANAAIAAWPSKKLSVRRSTTRRAVCASPIANVARLVLGGRVEDIKGPGSWGRRGRECLGLKFEPCAGVFGEKQTPHAHGASRRPSPQAVSFGSGGGAAFSMKDGLYSVHIHMLDGVKGRDSGVLILRGGVLIGGGPYFWSVGTYTVGNGTWKGQLTTNQHTPFADPFVRPLFGGQEVASGFSGTFAGDQAEVFGTTLAGNRSLSFRATLKKLADD